MWQWPIVGVANAGVAVHESHCMQKLWHVRVKECGSCGVWELRSLGVAEYGSCRVWKLKSMKIVECASHRAC